VKGEIASGDVTWRVLAHAKRQLAPIRKELGDDVYEESRKTLKENLCAYFSSSGSCTKRGRSVSPVGGTKGGGKRLKVRWALPGRGKSGSLRLAVVAYCDERLVKIAGAWDRKAEPSDEDLAAAFRSG
jgi:hypothetical protein